MSGNETIDALLRGHARDDGGRIALVDAPNRASVAGGAPRALTYAETDRIVEAIAQRLRALSLHRGSVVAVQLPHTVESILTCLGILRAGMVAALLPQLWRQRDIAAALAPLGPKAIVTATRIGKAATAEIAMTAAIDLFSVRYVCAFGDDPPDGVVSLDDVFDVGQGCGDDAATPPAHGDPDSTETAVFTFDTAWEASARDGAASGPVAVPRDHRKLIAGGQAVCDAAGLQAGASILSPLPLSSFAGLSLMMLPWLLTGGTLALHLPLDAEIFARQLRDGSTDCLILPGLVLPVLADLIAASPATVLGLWRAPERHAASAPWRDARPKLIDILSFGENGFVAVPRAPSEQPGAVAMSPSFLPTQSPVSMSLTASGTIALSGAMVARAMASRDLSASDETNDEVDTGFPGRIDPGSGGAVVTGGRPDTISVGGYAFQVADLDDLAGRTHLGATVTGAPDGLLGQRPAGQSLHRALVRELLAEQGANPLIVEAFRDPPPPIRPPCRPQTLMPIPQFCR